MLKVVVLRGNDKKKYQESFNPLKAHWIVSDLKTKVFLNKSLLQKRQIIYGEPVKRAAELWQNFMAQSHPPDYASVGFIGAWAMAKKFLASQDGQWYRRPRAAQTLVAACQQFSSFISHDLAAEYLAEFQKQFGSSFFTELLQLGIGFYEHCLTQKRIPRFFIPVLLGQNSLPTGGEYFFDLGAELLEVERDLLQLLARDNDTTVFVPEILQDLKIYKNLSLGLATAEKIEDGVASSGFLGAEIWRCASMDAEARKAAEKIAQLTAKGVASSDICVVAQDISFYENILDHDLKWQGLGLQRDLTSPLSGHRFFRRLNALLKITIQNWEPLDLVEAFSELTFQEKKTLKPATTALQIGIPWLQNKVFALQRACPMGEIGAPEFQKFILQLKKSVETTAAEEVTVRNSLLKILQKLKTEMGNDRFEMATWVEAWQNTVTQSDYVYQQADPNGVWAVDFHSLEEVPAKHFIFLGLNTKKSEKNYASDLSYQEKTFFTELGFNFEPSHFNWDELIEWTLGNRAASVVFSCAAVDAQGKALTPSSFWLEQAKLQNKNTEVCDSATNLNWLHMQKHISEKPFQEALEKFKLWPKNHAETLLNSVASELRESKKVTLPVNGERSLSASSIEQAWQCPFKFFAAYSLGLRSEDDLDVEPTPMMRGQILHAAVEEIMKTDLNFWNESNLTLLLDNLSRLQATVASDVWPSTRARLLRQLKRFIDFEKTWKKKFPLAQHAGFELSLNGYMDWDGKKLKFSTEPEKWKFKGRIDRMDKDSAGHGILLDYKDRVSAFRNISSWKKHGQFQLALYAQAVEAGLSDVKVKDVVGAFFYSLKNLERTKGFARSDLDLAGVLPEDLPKNTLVDEMTLKEFYEEINQEVGTVLEKLETGNLTPEPRQKTVCETCSWNNLCRSHTLL